MKKYLLSLSFILIASGVSIAQTQTANTLTPAPKQVHKTMADYQAESKAETEKMDKQLSLSPDQKAKLEQVNLKMAIINERAKQGNSDVALKHYAENRDNTYRQILTEEQFKKYKAMNASSAK